MAGDTGKVHCQSCAYQNNIAALSLRKGTIVSVWQNGDDNVHAIRFIPACYEEKIPTSNVIIINPDTLELFYKRDDYMFGIDGMRYLITNKQKRWKVLTDRVPSFPEWQKYPEQYLTYDIVVQVWHGQSRILAYRPSLVMSVNMFDFRQWLKIHPGIVFKLLHAYSNQFSPDNHCQWKLSAYGIERSQIWPFGDVEERIRKELDKFLEA